MTSLDEQEAAPGFETNAGSFRGGKARGAAGASSEKSDNPKGSFRDWHQQRKAEAGKSQAYVPPDVPTPERRAKGDRPKKTRGGFYRAPPPIERLRDRKMLDANPAAAAAMCQAAEKLYKHFYEAGLNGVAAQDLSREIRGSGATASSFPRTQRALENRQRFREACAVMGWFPDYPHRGCGRIVVDVVCYELGVKDAAGVHIGKGRDESILASGIDRLREGLFKLAKHWRLI